MSEHYRKKSILQFYTQKNENTALSNGWLFLSQSLTKPKYFRRWDSQKPDEKINLG